MQNLQNNAYIFAKNIQMTENTIEHLTKNAQYIKLPLYKQFYVNLLVYLVKMCNACKSVKGENRYGRREEGRSYC